MTEGLTMEKTDRIVDGATLARIGVVLDQLVTSDITARGLAPALYSAARSQAGVESLTMAAATALHDRVRPGQSVLICTGWPSRSWLMKGLTETDGPAGAAYLARALEQVLGIVPIIVVAPGLESFAEAAMRAAGLIVSNTETALQSKRGPYRASVGTVRTFTTDAALADGDAATLIDEVDAGAVIAVEMPGANEHGEYHNVTARLVPTEVVAKADALIRRATSGGLLTIGIGDGGNELGMGNIPAAVSTTLNHGERIAPATPVDHLVIGSVSNFGAVGLSAAVAAIGGDAGVLRVLDLQRITDRLADSGAIDGLTAYVDPNNDGLTPVGTRALMEIVTTAVEMHLGGWVKG